MCSEYEIERWQLPRPPTLLAAPELSALTEEVLKLDQKVFGADRSALLLSIAAECPNLCCKLPNSPSSAGTAWGDEARWPTNWGLGGGR